MQKLSLVILLFPLMATAQLAPNSIVVTASRNASTEADQMLFYVSLASGIDSTREEVLALMQGAGLTPADFSEVRYVSWDSSERPLTWYFTLTVPLKSFKNTLGILIGLANQFSKDTKFALSFSVSGPTVSGQSQQAVTCSVPDLLADARTQAAKLASGAGKSVGGIQSISGVTTADASDPAGAGGIGRPACSISVRFSLGGL